MCSFTLYYVEGRLKLLKFQHWKFFWLSQQFNFRFAKEYRQSPKMSRVGYLALATGRVWIISYKLRLSHMGSDVGPIFLTAS